METYTTQPGVQLYTGNWMTGNFEGKNGQRYPERAALCLETQHFPDSPNKPEYPTTELRPGEVFQSTTIYKFSVEMCIRDSSLPIADDSPNIFRAILSGKRHFSGSSKQSSEPSTNWKSNIETIPGVQVITGSL